MTHVPALPAAIFNNCRLKSGCFDKAHFFVQHEYFRCILRCMESAVASSVQGLVVAPRAVLSEAKDLFSQIGAAVEATSLEAVRNIQSRSGSGKPYVFLAFYVTHALKQEQFSATLRRVKRFRKAHFLVYVPHQQVELAFNVGQAMGRELGGTAEIASSVREAKQLLKSWDAVVTNPPYGLQSKDLLEARTRLGLTQEEMASALNVTARTLQNWERNLGTSQMKRKTRDLWELLELMDDYVVAHEEKSWLKTPRPAFRNKTPEDLITEGKIRDVIVQFQRLREGQPI